MHAWVSNIADAGTLLKALPSEVNHACKVRTPVCVCVTWQCQGLHFTFLFEFFLYLHVKIYLKIIYSKATYDVTTSCKVSPYLWLATVKYSGSGLSAT